VASVAQLRAGIAGERFKGPAQGPAAPLAAGASHAVEEGKAIGGFEQGERLNASPRRTGG